MGEPVAEIFMEVFVKTGVLASWLHLYLPEASQSNKLAIQSIQPHQVYTHLHVLLHVTEITEAPVLSSTSQVSLLF